MGYQAELDLRDRKPFKDGLRTLLRQLNNTIAFDEMVMNGVQEICIVADTAREPRHQRLFSGGYFRDWLREEWGITGGRFGSRLPSKVQNPAGFEERVWNGLNYLREFLSRDQNLIELAAVGPCALIIWSDDSDPRYEDSIGILNYVPGCMPNFDLSIRRSRRGIYWHG